MTIALVLAAAPLPTLRQADLVGLATATIVAATPLTLAALGGVLSERSGVVNIALEGIMLTAAFVGYAAALLTHSLGVGLLAAILSGMAIAALHAVLSIEFLVDQIVSDIPVISREGLAELGSILAALEGQRG